MAGGPNVSVSEWIGLNRQQASVVINAISPCVKRPFVSSGHLQTVDVEALNYLYT